MTKFSELLAEIQRSEGEVDGSCYTLQGRPQWFIQLLRDVQALATNIREVLKAHLSLFNIKSEEELARIKEHVLYVYIYIYRYIGLYTSSFFSFRNHNYSLEGAMELKFA